MRTKSTLILFTISLFLLAPNFFSYNIIEELQQPKLEDKFDASYISLNSIEKLYKFTDSIAVKKGINNDSLEWAILAEDIVTKRFYHNYSTKNLNENWLASVAEKITNLTLSANIVSDDILKKPYAYCVQQNTVLMDLLKRKRKHDYRVISFAHHFAFQSYINKKWVFFDADFQPKMSNEKRTDTAFIKNTALLKTLYFNGLNTEMVEHIFGSENEFKYGKINEVQGSNAQIFQSITNILSKTIFIFPLLLIVYLRKKRNAIAFHTKQTP